MPTPEMPTPGDVRRCSPVWSRGMAVLGIALLVAFGVQAQSDGYAEVQRLLQASQYSQALSRVEQFLEDKPRDPQMRFFKGVIQSETGKSSEAIATFVKLTEDFPELPEPHNNLAVLYARTNQLDKARVSLEMAIRTNPSYATAHENLGDIYARLAGQAYAKALQLDASSASVQPKLTLIRDLFTPGAGVRVTAASSAQRQLPRPPSAAAASPAGSVQPVVPPLQPKVNVVTSSPGGSAQVSVAPPVVVEAAQSVDVQKSLQAWARAWSERNIAAYLAAYGKEFTPVRGLSRSAWEEERRQRIMGKKHISVRLTDIKIKMTGENKALVHFRQDYQGDGLASSTRKTLEWVKSGNTWVIIREASG